MTDHPIGILLMAYGTPETPADVEPYFTHIRGGRTPSPAAVENLQQRYALVGGRTPLLDITNDVQAKLQDELNRAEAGRYRVYAGMKHWHPFIGAVMPQMAADGIREVIALALAPHYSRISIGGYRKAVEAAQAALGHPFQVTFVESWGMQPQFLDMMTDLVRGGLEQFPPEQRAGVLLVFSAHSLPERIRTWNDPYEAQLRAGSAAVAARLGRRAWRFAWQSEGNTGEPWIGPDICNYLETLHAEGVQNVLQIPIGFVADHLEIFFDIDHEAKDKAQSLGMTLQRTALPNARPEFIRTLVAVVAAAQAGTAVMAAEAPAEPALMVAEAHG